MSAAPQTQVDAIVIGAGFAGFYMLKRSLDLGMTVQGFEADGGVGGTWYWNRYPGAHCDLESLNYSYSFSPSLSRSGNQLLRQGAKCRNVEKVLLAILHERRSTSLAGLSPASSLDKQSSTAILIVSFPSLA